MPALPAGWFATFLVTTAIGIAFSAATAAIGLLLGGAQQGNSSGRSRDQRVRQNITETTAYIPVVYGRAKTGALRTFYETKLAYKGTENVEGGTIDTRGDYLYVCATYSMGEVADIEEVYLDGILSTDDRFRSPYRADITFTWSASEPTPDVELVSGFYLIEPLSILQLRALNPDYADSEITIQNLYLAQVTTYGKYRIRRVNTATGKEDLVIKEKGGPNSVLTQAKTATIRTTEYGTFNFYLEYVKPTGEVVHLADATVTIAQDNVDFNQSVNNGLTIAQDSSQEGEFLKQEERYGGTDNLTPIDWMVSADIGWDSNRIGNGLCYQAFRFLKHTKGFKKPDKNPYQGIPQITAVIKGKLLYDFRLDDTVDGGSGSHRFDDPTTWEWSDNPAVCIFDYLTNQDYGAKIPYERIDLDSFIEAADFCDELVLRPSGESTTRYTCNGVLETSQPPKNNLNELLTCCNGRIGVQKGFYKLVIYKPETSTATFTEDQIVGSVTIDTTGVRTKQNHIKAQYYDPDIKYFENFVDVTSDNFLTQDKGKEYLKDLNYPFTTDYDQVVTLATIALKQSRKNKRVTLSTNMTTFNSAPGDVIALTYEPFGYVEKLFRISQMTLKSSSEASGAFINFVLDEHDDQVFDVGNYDLKPAITNTTLTNPFDIQPPTGFQFAQTKKADLNGTVSTVIQVFWYPSQNAGAVEYQVDYKNASAGEWQLGGNVYTAGIELFNLQVGTYDIRCKALADNGHESDYLTGRFSVLAPGTIPGDVQGLALKNGNKNVKLTWLPNADITTNGYYRIKHIPDISASASWSDSATFITYAPGNSTEATLAQIDGTYMVKAVNISGIESANEAKVVLDLPDDVNYQTVITNQADPTWAGTMVNTVDITGSLFLESSGLFDSRAGLFDDALGNFDYGESGYSNVGTYTFSDTSDLGGVYKVKLKRSIQAVFSSAGITFDEASGTFTEREGFFDGTTTENHAEVLLVRTTRDDPSSSPTWSDWVELTENELTGRGFQFRLELFKQSNDSQTEIEQARSLIQLPLRTEVKDVSITSSGQTVNYDYAFYSAPQLQVSIKNPATGDYIAVSGESRTGFTITVNDSGGSPVTTRTISYSAQGLGQEIV